MDMVLVLATGLCSYLIGSFSFARLITRLWSGKDITQFEIPVQGTADRYKVLSIGGNSVSSVLGPKAGMIVSLLDILKIFLPVLFFRLYFSPQPGYMLVSALAGLVGHVWPLYFKFHGGTGFSAILGALLAIDPLAVLVANILGILLGLVVFRSLIVVSMGWIWLLIPWFWWRSGGDPVFILFAFGINVLIILAMIPEIKNGLKYKREGKYMEYGLGSLSSHPMGRGMLKMARFFGFMKEEIKEIKEE